MWILCIVKNNMLLMYMCISVLGYQGFVLGTVSVLGVYLVLFQNAMKKKKWNQKQQEKLKNENKTRIKQS